jgi:2-polyprenyl-3-methyl-5-hydroxy-6-metoxy-1,4-benzoquinol methylase
LVFVSPRPSAAALTSLYTERYFKNDRSGEIGYADYLGDEGNIRRTFARRLAGLERRVPPGRVLDVGCAAGFFLDEARKRGWTANGVDISAFAVRYAEAQLGYAVQEARIGETDFPAGLFDLITFWDVLEHVPDPAADLKRAALLLRPGGILSLTTPDLGSLPARLTSARWIGYKLSQEHIYHFTQEHLRQLLGLAGLQVADVRHVGKYVTVEFSLDRLGRYFPRLASWLARAARAAGVSHRVVYLDPLDILWVTARKP